MCLSYSGFIFNTLSVLFQSPRMGITKIKHLNKAPTLETSTPILAYFL